MVYRIMGGNPACASSSPLQLAQWAIADRLDALLLDQVPHRGIDQAGGVVGAKIRKIGAVAAQLFAILHRMRKDFGNADGQVRHLLEEHVAGRARPGIDEVVVEDDATDRGALGRVKSCKP